MERMNQMREFLERWITDVSPITIKVLIENGEHTTKCEINFNDDILYEIDDPPYTHVVNVKKKVCSLYVIGTKGNSLYICNC